MRVLVYGAGNIGCLYAGLLRAAGHDVSILARGPRLAAIRDHGLTLKSVDGKTTTVTVEVVESLGEGDIYDVVLVALPGDRVTEALPALGAHRGSESVVFFGNRACGPHEFVDALGADRVLLGFPGAAAVWRDDGLHYLICSPREQPTMLGELDGARSDRVESMARALESAGFPVAISDDMDAWLKTHVAEIVPTANALYMAGLDPQRLSRYDEALDLMIDAIREGYQVLTALGVPITPPSHRVFRWIPEPLLIAIMKHEIKSPETELKLGHASAARGEMRALAEEFRELARSAKIETPAMDRLRLFADPDTPPAVGGSMAREIVSWGATEQERDDAMPGDGYLSGQAARSVVMTRAVSIDAPPEQVWPWLAQLGRGAGWYSYDLLDNHTRHSARHIVSWIPSPREGDASPIGYLRRLVPGSEITWWLDGVTFLGSSARLVVDIRLTPAADGRSRLVIRNSGDATGGVPALALWAFRWIDGFMAKRQLLGIKDRVERYGVREEDPDRPESGARDQYQYWETIYRSGESAGTPGTEQAHEWRRRAIADGVIPEPL